MNAPFEFPSASLFSRFSRQHCSWQRCFVLPGSAERLDSLFAGRPGSSERRTWTTDRGREVEFCGLRWEEGGKKRGKRERERKENPDGASGRKKRSSARHELSESSLWMNLAILENEKPKFLPKCRRRRRGRRRQDDYALLRGQFLGRLRLLSGLFTPGHSRLVSFTSSVWGKKRKPKIC